MTVIYTILTIAVYILLFWIVTKAYEAKDEADKVYADGIQKDFDKLTDNFRYMSYPDYLHHVDKFKREWKGRVSKERLSEYTRSLEEWPSICL